MFHGASLEGEYNVDEVYVLGVDNNKIIVDYTSYSDDNSKIEIAKPFYKWDIKNGSIINVRYPINHPEKMQYVASFETGELMLVIGIYVSVIIFVFNFLVGMIKYVNKKIC